MKRVLSDDEIESLVRERKLLPRGWESRLEPKPKSDTRFSQREWEVKGENGNIFRIVLRQNNINLLDFSIILIFRDKYGNEFRLRRFNGRHPSQHTNRLEHSKGLPNASFRSMFHIHRATQRYQEEGFEIDGYAETTSDYSSFEGALRIFLQLNGFQEDLPLFDGQGARK
jgi:hypothetical protein